VFAHRSYLDRCGSPTSLDELAAHRIVDHGGYWPIVTLRWWQEFLARHGGIALRPNCTAAFVAAVRAGYGIGLFPRFYRIVAPDLVELDVRLDADAPLWLLSHEETNRSARVQATLEFLRRRFEQDRPAWFS
jgi:DNA-binding transcriptional LysR family regulator